MARRNDKGTLLLFLVGGVAFIIAKTFEFVMDNILAVGILVGVGLGIFALIKYKDHYDDKKEKERNIQNANLKGIKEKYEQAKNQIEDSRKHLLFKIDQINTDLLHYTRKSLNTDTQNLYDPVKANSDLNNILKTKQSNNNEIWDLLYDNRKFPHENPEKEFDQRIKKIELFNEPKYFSQKDNTQEKSKNEFTIKIEQEKTDYNKNLKSQFNSGANEVEQKVISLKEMLKKSKEKWQSEYQNFENEKAQKNNESLGSVV